MNVQNISAGKHPFDIRLQTLIDYRPRCDTVQFHSHLSGKFILRDQAY